MVITKKEYGWWQIYIYVVITYILSHGLMLLVYGAWWDDMLLWNVSSQDLESFIGPEHFNNPFMYHTIRIIASINDMKTMTFIYRLVPFICWFVSVTSFFVVIKTITQNRTFTLYTSLLAASCGLNKTMLMICCYHYSISITLFMIGLVFFIYDYYRSKNLFKILAATLWTISLLVWRPAVLVIPAIVVFACCEKISFKWKVKENYVKLVKYGMANYWILILGLCLFAILYTTLLAPKGEYVSYYNIDTKHIILSPLLTITSCISIFVQFFSGLFDAFAFPGKKYILSFIPLVCITLLLIKHNHKWYTGNKLLVVATIVFFFSIYPQTLIGDNINFYFDMGNQHSRIASLAIFPISVLICYFIKNISLKIQPIIMAIVVSGSIMFSIYTFLDYERGWARNEAISQYLKENPQLEGKNIMVYNNAMEYSIFEGTGDSYYEYEGCARLAYGVRTKTKFVSYYVNDINSIIENPDYHLVMLRNDEIPTYILMKDRLFSPCKYQKEISNMLVFLLYDKQPSAFKKDIIGN